MRRSERLAAAVFWLSVVTAAGMFVVLLMGANVTATGSEHGCGRQWPLCDGRFVPDLALGTALQNEFAHRAVAELEGLLVAALTLAVLLLYRRQRTIQVLAGLMAAFLLLQAGLGAWAVMAPQQPVALALHFGISLIALATTTLTALYLRRPAAMLSAPAVSRGVRLTTWGAAAYLYLLVYSGAYVRHTAAAAACSSWPLCGTGAPLGPGAVAANLVHRGGAAVAVLVFLVLLVLYHRARPARLDLVAGGWVLVAAMAAQGAAGAYLVLSRWSVSGELVHDAVAGLAFTAVAYLCLRVTVGGQEVREPAAAPTPRLRTEAAP